MKPSGERTGEEALYRTSKIVWMAFTASIVSYFAVAMAVKPVTEVSNPNVERVLMILVVAYLVISVPAKKWLLVQAKEVDSDTLRRLALLVPMVLSQIAGVTGLALWLVTGSPHYYVFLFLAMAGMLLHYPRRMED